MSGPRPVPAPDACSALWDAADLPAAGSASAATFWVALEQNGPWGRDAIADSHLDATVGAELARRCADGGGRLLLIREPGKHADHREGSLRRVLVAGGLASVPFLLSGAVSAPEELLALPFEALSVPSSAAARDAVPSLQPTAEPALLVCTNGRRDVCCAVRGRPIALEASARRSGQVWECSHTGGHRFAPTGITLPSGHTWARLTEELAIDLLDAEQDGRIALGANDIRRNRGRSCLPAPVQAAEAWWRQQEGETRLGGITWSSAETDDGVRVRLTHQDGRHTTVLARLEDDPGERRDSCSKALGPTRTWRIGPR